MVHKAKYEISEKVYKEIKTSGKSVDVFVEDGKLVLNIEEAP